MVEKIRIEEGKHYLTNGGDIIGPMYVKFPDNFPFEWGCDTKTYSTMKYTSGGRTMGIKMDKWHLNAEATPVPAGKIDEEYEFDPKAMKKVMEAGIIGSAYRLGHKEGYKNGFANGRNKLTSASFFWFWFVSIAISVTAGVAFSLLLLQEVSCGTL